MQNTRTGCMSHLPTILKTYKQIFKLEKCEHFFQIFGFGPKHSKKSCCLPARAPPRHVQTVVLMFNSGTQIRTNMLECIFLYIHIHSRLVWTNPALIHSSSLSLHQSV